MKRSARALPCRPCGATSSPPCCRSWLRYGSTSRASYPIPYMPLRALPTRLPCCQCLPTCTYMPTRPPTPCAYLRHHGHVAAAAGTPNVLLLLLSNPSPHFSLNTHRRSQSTSPDSQLFFQPLYTLTSPTPSRQAIPIYIS
eukprot:366063-Chlamydomonas_euryale.AAC.11